VKSASRVGIPLVSRIGRRCDQPTGNGSHAPVCAGMHFQMAVLCSRIKIM
jgi:hypothetical protein